MRVHKVRLIDHTYDIGIAGELMHRFIDAKIGFIEDRIKNGCDQSEINQLKGRIEDLQAEKRSLDLFMDTYDGEDVKMEVGCTIVMSIQKNETRSWIESDISSK